jgi:proliferating cell nuclear antigen PCNA
MDIIIQNVKAEVFTTLFQHIKLFTEHINLMFLEDKLFVQGMDSSRVSVFEIYLPNTWFDSYQLAEGQLTLGIQANILFRVLNTRDKTQDIQLHVDSAEDDNLSVSFASVQKTNFDKHFQVPLMSIDSEMLSIPEMESDAEFSIPSSKFAVLVDQLKLFGDTLEIQCSEEKILMTASSLEHGKMTVEIPIDDLTSFSITEGEQVNVAYSLSHLHNICAYSKICTDTTVHLSANFPVKLVYNVGLPDANIVFYLAPKLNE